MSQITPQKYIFLDIDGVLASLRVDHVRNRSDEVIHEFDPIAVGLLNDLCKKHKAKLVIISTWAAGSEYTRDSLLEFFRTTGFTGEFAQDWRIDDPTARDRTVPMQRYLEKNNIDLKDCIVINDEKPPKNKPHYAARWVSPLSGYNGFLYQDYLRADALLAGRALTKDERTVIDHMNGQWKPGRIT